MQRLLFTLLVLMLSFSISQAQRLCEALVENALEQAGENCAEQDGELVCYAYDSLSATFFDTFDGIFTRSSRLDLPILHTVKSNAIDLEEDEWGIAYTQLKSNLPEATADSSVRLIMLGDVLLENTVDESVGVALDSLLVTVTADSSLYESPDSSGDVVEEVTSGIVLEAIGQSPDGEWVGITATNQTLWIATEDVTSGIDLANLPEIEENVSAGTSRGGEATAFGQLFFQTGGQSECQEAPNTLVVQGPEDQSVEVTLNGVPIRIGSTISVGTDMRNGELVMWVTVLSGSATLYPDTPEAVRLEPLQVSYSPISSIYAESTAPIEDYVMDEPLLRADGTPYLRLRPGTSFSTPQPLSTSGFSFTSLSYYDTLYLIPESLLNYPLQKPEEEEPEEPVTSQSINRTPIIEPVTTEEPEVINNCDPNVLNYCLPGNPWGDGRCNSPDPNVTAYNYEQGWYQAALDCGVIDSLPVVSEGGRGASISCTFFPSNVDIRFSISWGTPVSGQVSVYGYYTVNEESYGDRNYSFNEPIGANDRSVEIVKPNFYYYRMANSNVYLVDGSGNRISNEATCKNG